MNCDDARRAFAAGGPLARWRSNRHAARCTQCRMDREAYGQIAGALSTNPPLTDAQRALWLGAAKDEGADHAAEALPPAAIRAPWLVRHRKPLLAAAAVLLIGFLGAYLAWSRRGPHRPVDAPPRSNEVTLAFRAEMSRRIDNLDDGLDQLEAELAELERRAGLLDARREADALCAVLERPTTTVNH